MIDVSISSGVCLPFNPSHDGLTAELENVYIRGNKVRFMILPDMLKNAPMFKKVQVCVTASVRATVRLFSFQLFTATLLFGLLQRLFPKRNRDEHQTGSG